MLASKDVAFATCPAAGLQMPRSSLGLTAVSAPPLCSDSTAEALTCAGTLKQQCTVLVVSHNLGEISSLVDCAWQMQPGGKLASAPVPNSQGLGS